MKYYLGIDVGGTFVKAAVVDEAGEIVANDKIPTDVQGGAEKIVSDIAKTCSKLAAAVGRELSDFVGIGMGVPGMVDGKTGLAVYIPNLGWRNFDAAGLLSSLTGLPVKMANDANAAALGETKFGAGKKYDNTVMITLGTGVGGGVIIEGKLFEGFKGAGTELGHSVIQFGGEPCSCGRHGCLEAYASATALIRETKRAMQKNPKSELWQVGDIDAVNGKTAFDFYSSDADARAVVDTYIERLACGLINFANEFRPEAIILGGGVCAQGDALVKPLQKILDNELYARGIGPDVRIITAELGNNAGSIGAAALFMD